MAGESTGAALKNGLGIRVVGILIIAIMNYSIVGLFDRVAHLETELAVAKKEVAVVEERLDQEIKHVKQMIYYERTLQDAKRKN